MNIGRKPLLTNLVPFGTEVHVIDNGHYLTKFQARTVPGFIVGFTIRRNTYQVYVPKWNKVISSCDVFFKPHDNGKDREMQARIYREDEHVPIEFSAYKASNEESESTKGEEQIQAKRPYHTGTPLTNWFEYNREINRLKDLANNSELESPPVPPPRSTSMTETGRPACLQGSANASRLAKSMAEAATGGGTIDFNYARKCHNRIDKPYRSKRQNVHS